MKYDLELEKAVDEIKRNNAKLVCIQIPEGIKPMAGEIKDYLEDKTESKIIIWMGSCFGACDVPLQLEHMNIDLLIQFGHSRWEYAT